MQCHLGGNLWQAFHQEVGCPHPHLERGEGVFGGFATLAHGLRVLVEALLRGLQYMLVLPARNTSLRTGRAARFERAISARIGPIAPQFLSLLLVRVVVLQVFASRTAIDVLIAKINEVLFAESAPCLKAR